MREYSVANTLENLIDKFDNKIVTSCYIVVYVSMSLQAYIHVASYPKSKENYYSYYGRYFNLKFAKYKFFSNKQAILSGWEYDVVTIKLMLCFTLILAIFW